MGQFKSECKSEGDTVQRLIHLQVLMLWFFAGSCTPCCLFHEIICAQGGTLREAVAGQGNVRSNFKLIPPARSTVFDGITLADGTQKLPPPGIAPSPSLLIWNSYGIVVVGASFCQYISFRKSHRFPNYCVLRSILLALKRRYSADAPSTAVKNDMGAISAADGPVPMAACSTSRACGSVHERSSTVQTVK